MHDYAERIVLRILPLESSLQIALKLGYKPAHIICMQGPFSKELNVAMLKKYGSKFMVTKDSGAVGGFDEKVEAAAAAGAFTRNFCDIGSKQDTQNDTLGSAVHRRKPVPAIVRLLIT